MEEYQKLVNNTRLCEDEYTKILFKGSNFIKNIYKNKYNKLLQKQKDYEMITEEYNEKIKECAEISKKLMLHENDKSKDEVIEALSIRNKEVENYKNVNDENEKKLIKLDKKILEQTLQIKKNKKIEKENKTLNNRLTAEIKKLNEQKQDIIIKDDIKSKIMDNLKEENEKMEVLIKELQIDNINYKNEYEKKLYELNMLNVTLEAKKKDKNGDKIITLEKNHEKALKIFEVQHNKKFDELNKIKNEIEIELKCVQSEIKNSNDKHVNETIKFQTEIEFLKDDNKNLKNTLNQNNEELNKLKALTIENEMLNKKIENYKQVEDENELLKINYESAIKDNKKLENDIKKTKLNIDKLNYEIEKYKKEIVINKEKENLVSIFEKERIEYKNKFKNMENEMNKIKNQISQQIVNAKNNEKDIQNSVLNINQLKLTEKLPFDLNEKKQNKTHNSNLKCYNLEENNGKDNALNNTKNITRITKDNKHNNLHLENFNDHNELLNNNNFDDINDCVKDTNKTTTNKKYNNKIKNKISDHVTNVNQEIKTNLSNESLYVYSNEDDSINKNTSIKKRNTRKRLNFTINKHLKKPVHLKIEKEIAENKK
ncbi:hypothetical protein COBT_003439, partial [Conglomerata obtusa]